MDERLQRLGDESLQHMAFDRQRFSTSLAQDLRGHARNRYADFGARIVPRLVVTPTTRSPFRKPRPAVRDDVDAKPVGGVRIVPRNRVDGGSARGCRPPTTEIRSC